MSDEVGRIDWKTVFAGVALSWTILIGGGALFRSHLLASVDQRIAEHSESAAARRDAFLRELEQRAEGSYGRLLVIEQHCATIRDWRGRVDADLGSLLDWRDRCSQRQERTQAWIENDSKRMDVLENKIDKLKDRLGNHK